MSESSARLVEYGRLAYAKSMTLSQRNRFFVAAISLSALFLLLILAAAIVSIPLFPRFTETAARRAQPFLNNFFPASPYVPFISMLGAAFYSLIVCILLLYFFEKTQAPEIVFFALFALSLSLETLRSVVFFTSVFKLAPIYLAMSARLLFFGRYFGLFCLFAASVYAAGLNFQKQENIIAIAAIIAVIIAIGIPLDSLSWDSSFTMESGFKNMFIMAEIGITLITALSFFVGAYSRGIKEYVLIGFSILLILSGRSIIRNSDTWLTLPAGAALLGTGSWLACSRIHKVYLWL